MRIASRGCLAWLLLTMCNVANFAAAQENTPRDAEATTTEDAPATRGDRRVTNIAAGQQRQYRQSWALIIGIDDYTNAARSDAERVYLRKLSNAEQDASAVHKLLLEHYGYDREHALLLLGENATHQAILDQLTAFSDESKVNQEDSVLVYFAGHGGRIEGDARERGAIYPQDVQLGNGRPLGRYIGLHGDLVGKLKKSAARHRLIVLDSCHSGEIFSLEARPRSETDNRQQAYLFSQPAIQAIASCRATQLASDGRDGHSPFTSALIRALTQLPAREVEANKSPLWTNKLFGYMRSELTSIPDGQSPDCRCLSGDDGEFYLYPRGDFSRYASHVTEFRLLQAMVPSEHGNWWFDETPWFMPSLRRMILEEMEDDTKERSSVESLAIVPEKLRELADQAIVKMRGSADPLVQMRLRHLEPLFRGQNRNEIKTHLAEVVAELSKLADDESPLSLDATDLHFLAVAQHSLGDEAAQDTYRLALKKYEGDGEQPPTLHGDALKALCHADLGQYLLDGKSDCLAAAREYQAALSPFGTTAPGAFRVYVLCCEADCWQRLNRWGEANRRLLTALDVANGFDADHGLTAFVWRRRAWAGMEQWKIAEASASFQKANEILLKRVELSPESAEQTAVPNGLAPEEALLLAGDFDALIAYLHNLHGLAMVKRFTGDGIGSTQDYRLLAGKIASALARLRQNSVGQKSTSDVEPRLVERLINTQERLADCNLFGHPDICDVKEAIDDYRRALGMCHELPGFRRERTRLGLLFKLSLALATPSPAQDTQLARAYCRQAVEIHKPIADSVSEVLRTYASLIPPIVELLSHETAADVRLSAETDKVQPTPLSVLRQSILALRERGGPNLHRDQLEVLLLAAKALGDHDSTEDRFNLAEDAEMLLGFCRLALPKQVANLTLAAANRQETRQYLRPYYDTVLRNKLRLGQKHVKDLLELQWEATRGEFYLKQPTAHTVLAMYVLDGKCHLFLDVPRGVSKSFCLEDDLDLRSLLAACDDTSPKLALPREVLRELERVRDRARAASGDTGVAVELECWWVDPVQGIGRTEVAQPPSDNPARVITMRPTSPGSFPFTLPPYVRPFDHGVAPDVPELPAAASTGQ